MPSLSDGLNVYLIRVYNDNEDFFKIGTTVHKYCRFYQIMKFGYNVDIVYMILGLKCSDGFYYEELLQSTFINNAYIPFIKFGGYTECFLNIDLEKYKEIINPMNDKNKIEDYTIIR